MPLIPQIGHFFIHKITFHMILARNYFAIFKFWGFFGEKVGYFSAKNDLKILGVLPKKLGQ